MDLTWAETSQLPWQGPHLDGGGAPLDEVGQLALPDALQALVHLRRVHLALHRTCRLTPALIQAVHSSDTVISATQYQVPAFTRPGLRSLALY